MAGHPHPGRRQLVAPRGEDVARRPVGHDSAARLEDDHPVDQVQHLVDAVLARRMTDGPVQVAVLTYLALRDRGALHD